MARRLILDTGVLSGLERGTIQEDHLLSSDDDVRVAAICVAELVQGSEITVGDLHVRRSRFVEDVLRLFEVEPYDVEVARAHGRLLAHARAAGATRGSHDLILAATALATQRAIVTTDRRARFGELPGVECLEVD